MDASAVLKGLRTTYKLHTTQLQYKTPWQFLVAVILSAQCTDAQVNRVTPGLFAKYPDPQSLAKASLPAIEKLVYSTGFYKAKAKNCKKAAQHVIKEHNGKLPATLAQLIRIPGVGRKTANVFLQVVHGKAEGVVVDTHIFRVSKRTGAATGNTAEQVEQDLMQSLPQKDWAAYGDLVIQHGRHVCFARKPNCDGCVLKKQCPSAFSV